MAKKRGRLGFDYSYCLLGDVTIDARKIHQDKVKQSKIHDISKKYARKYYANIENIRNNYNKFRVLQIEDPGRLAAMNMAEDIIEV